MEPLIVCAGMDRAREMRLSLIALSLGISMRTAGPDAWGQPLGALCGLDRRAAGKAGKPLGEMLVMAFFDDGLMNRFLAALRQNGVRVPLKAVLTPHNRAWPLTRLYTELKTEAAVLEAGGGTGP